MSNKIILNEKDGFIFRFRVENGRSWQEVAEFFSAEFGVPANIETVKKRMVRLKQRLKKHGKTINDLTFSDDLNAYFTDKGLVNFSEKKAQSNQRETPFAIKNQSQEYQEKTKERIFTDVITIFDKRQEITPKMVMEAHKLDTDEWEVVNYKLNFWETQKSAQFGGGTQLQCQSKLVVKPKVKQELTFKDIDNYFAKKDYSKDKLPINCLRYDPNGEILEIALPDLHIGMLSWENETGENYDLKIVKERYFAAINDVVERCKHKKIKKIVFVSLGDLIHVDNDKQTTTNGTFQQMDGRFTKVIEVAEDMIIDGVTILGEIAPVEVIYICGNHDRNTGYMLMRSASNAFRNDKNVTFDTLPNPQKCRLFGNCLIGWLHGDTPKKNMTDWLSKNHRDLFAKAKFIEIHSGHCHSFAVQEVGVVILKTLPTLCSSSYWEHQQGYSGGWKSLACHIWNEKTGLRDMWFTNIA